MSKRIFWSVILTASLLFASAPAQATLIGDTIFGELNFGGFGLTNFFDPANGFVPGGAGPQPLAPVVDPGIEYMYLNGFSGINVDFFAQNMSFIQFPAAGGCCLNSWEMRFSDLDFTEGPIVGVTVVSDFPGLTHSFTADSLTLSFPGGPPIEEQGFAGRVVFELQQVPEPGVAGLLGLGLAAVGLMRKKGRQQGSA